MKKFTRFWQLTMVLLFMSSFAFAQNVEKKVQLKEQFKPQTASEEAAVEEMWKNGIEVTSLKDKEIVSVEKAKTQLKKMTDNQSPDLSSVKATEPGGYTDDLLCPAGSVWGVPTTGYTNAGNSDADGGYRIFQQITGSGTYDVTEVHFWGIHAFFNGSAWVACTEEPLDFEIAFWNNAGGLPGTLINSYAVNLAGVGTGTIFGGLSEIMEYNFVIPATQSLQNAWVSVQANPGGDPNCWYLWVNGDGTTPVTVAAHAQQQVVSTGAFTELLYPMSLCAMGTYTPPSCLEPTGLTTSLITVNSARANWVKGGTEALWNLEYGPAGFPQGTGTLLTGLTNPNPFGNPYYNLTGLAGSTTYDWYVQADCGGGSTSAWVKGTFTTLCVPVVAPWFEDFDNGVPVAPTCWTNTSSNGDLWKITTVSIGHSAPSDHTTGTGYFAAVDDSQNTPLTTDATLTTPFIDVSGLTTPQLDFWLYSDNEGSGWNMTLRINVWDGAAWNNNFATFTGNTAGWEMRSVIMSGLTITGDIQIQFVGDETSSGTSFYDDISIDDVSVVEAPTCPPPSGLSVANVTNVSADLLFTSFSGLSNIEWGPAGFTPGTGTLVSGVTSSPYALGGLSILTGYDFYVQDDCGGGDLSSWVMGSFFTAGDCDWSCVGSDSYGDGWNGGSIDFVVNGNIVANWAGPATTGPETFYFPILEGSVVDIVWNVGSWDGEVTYDIYNALGGLEFSDGPAPTGTTGLNGTCVAPACPNPTNLTATNITSSSADLLWTTNSGLSDLEWGPAGFTPGTGTMVTGITTGSYSLTGISGAYDWYVMDDCGGGTTSFWVGSTFATLLPNDLCADAITIDCATGFVNGTTVGATFDNVGTCTTSNTAPGVWYKFTGVGNDYIDLSLCNTLPTWDSKLSVFSGDCAALTCVVGNDDNCGLLSAVSFLSAPGVDYYILVHGFSANVGAFQLDITCTPTYVVSGTLSYANGASTPIDNSTVDFYDNTPTYLGSVTTSPIGEYGAIVFGGDYSLAASTTKPRGGTAVGDVNVVVNHILGTPLVGLPFLAAEVTGDAIVDVSDLNGLVNEILGVNPGWPVPDWVFETPAFTVGSDVVVDFQGLCAGDPDGSFTPAYTCAAPTGLAAINIGGLSADLTWTSNSGLSNLEWGPAGFTPGTGTMATGVTSPYSISGLTLGTAYDFYVQDDCSPYAVSAWAGPATFTTLASLYCVAGPSSTFDSNVQQVDITGDAGSAISHTGCPGVAGTQDLTALSVTLTAGGSYSIDITFGTCGGSYFGAGQAWVDWNQNGIFEAGESLGQSSGTPGTAPWNAPVTFNFVVPAGATVGTTVIRVMQREGGALPLDPCGTYTWGSVMDFTVVVQ